MRNVNFGASKLSITGNATIEELEEAGAFDGIKVIPTTERRLEPIIPFYKRKENIIYALSLIFPSNRYRVIIQYSENISPAIVFFAISIAIGGASMFKIGITKSISF